jgi:phosphatidylserine decarboxylase
MADRTSRIEIWNRAERRMETEQVYGDFWLRLLYGTGVGRTLARGVLSGPALSRLGGALQSTRRSARRVRSFIDAFDIPMDEFETREWASFNDFFIRRFRPGAREFCSESHRMPAFCEARYLAFEFFDVETSFPVKGRFLTPLVILNDTDLAEIFDGGPLLIARLAPVDYHRFHFPDDGEVIKERRISGRLHSGNPFALRHCSDILAINERHVTVLHTANFGTLAHVEVGAMNVGKIVQTYPPGESFRRGGEKGYFCFGASTILLFGEPGRWTPSNDLLEQTRQHRETLVRLGDEVATCPR